MTRRANRRRQTKGRTAAQAGVERVVVATRGPAVRTPGRAQSHRTGGGGRLGLAVVGLVGAVALGAVLLRGFAGNGPAASGPSGAASTLRPSGATGSSGGGVVVTGRALVPFGDGPDAAIGRPIPAVRGTTLAGAPFAIPTNDGRAKVVLLLAHWCGHCQAEVPRVQAWIDAGLAPADVDLYAISTSADAQRPNYPPAAWLTREHWSVPTIADDGAGTIARAFGLQAFPFFVFINADGTVARRTAGQLSTAELEAILATLRR